jgi:hypothetical protein
VTQHPLDAYAGLSPSLIRIEANECLRECGVKCSGKDAFVSTQAKARWITRW